MIYFVQIQNDDEYVKIGITKGSIKARMSTMQSDCPYPLVLIGSMDSDSTELEREIQAEFAHLKVQGEWYRAAPELLDFAKGGHEEFVGFWEAVLNNELVEADYEQSRLPEGPNTIGYEGRRQVRPPLRRISWVEVRDTGYVFAQDCGRIKP